MTNECYDNFWHGAAKTVLQCDNHIDYTEVETTEHFMGVAKGVGVSDKPRFLTVAMDYIHLGS